MKLLWKDDDFSSKEPDQPSKSKKVITPTQRVEKTPREDASDTFYIREKIVENMSLRDKMNYRIEVKPTKPNCFRVSVWSKWPVKVVDSYWVERVQDGYIFTPPLRENVAEENTI